jgi:transposase
MSWHFEFRIVDGNRYLYLVEKRRTEKGPRNTQVIYIGTADTLLRKLASPREPLKSFEFGKMAALLHAATETGLLEAFRTRVPSSLFDGYSVERILFLQLAARVEKPLSREVMAQWLPDSALPFLMPLVGRPSSRTLRRYLKRLFGSGEQEERGRGILTRAIVHRVEEDVFRALVKKGIDPRFLLFDTTNFFVEHQAGRFPARGHSKEKRYDKRLVGLGLVTVGNLPVLTEVYPGNLGDAKVFAEVFDTLAKRLVDLEVATERMIMVFDRGINSTDNFEKVRGAMHVIAALNRSQARGLFRVPLSEFTRVAEDSEGRPVLGYPGRWSGFGQEWRVLVTYRKELAEHEERTWDDVRSRVVSKVEEWRRKRPATQQAALWRKVTQLIPRAFAAEFKVEIETIATKRRGRPARGYWPKVHVIPVAEARLRASFGKTAVLTDLPRAELSDTELVEGFVARGQIEEDFRWLKDRYVVSVKPFYLWQDATVPGHAFLCAMGLLLLRYLQWELRALHLSMKELVEALERIKVVLLRTPEGKARLVLEKMGPKESQVHKALNLQRFIPG